MLNCMIQPCSIGLHIGIMRQNFFPYNLNGSVGEGHPVLNVYMRDGHHGIIYIKLHDTAL